MNQSRLILLTLFMLACILPLCACIYRPDIQQGNVINAADVRGIHKGMSQEQIRFKLGKPVLNNIYTDNRMVYVYTFQHGHRKIQHERLIIYFQYDRVTNVWYDAQSPHAAITLPQPH